MYGPDHWTRTLRRGKCCNCFARLRNFFIWHLVVLHGPFYFVGTADTAAFLWHAGCLQICWNVTKPRVLGALETVSFHVLGAFILQVSLKYFEFLFFPTFSFLAFFFPN